MPLMASKHQRGRPVTMLQASWPLMGFAIRQTQSSRNCQSQDRPGGEGQRQKLLFSSPR